MGTVSVYYGRCSQGDRFCHSGLPVGREESKDKDKMLMQINMRDEQKERSTQKRLRKNGEKERSRIMKKPSEKPKDMRVISSVKSSLGLSK